MKDGCQGLVVLSGQRPEASDLNLIKLAAFVGVSARRVTLTGECDNIWQLIVQQARGGECAVCVNASTLRKCLERSVLAQSAGVELARSAVQLFVYGFDADTGDSELVRALSCGAFDSVRRIGLSESQYSVEKNSKAFCQEFSGLTFGPTNPANDLAFQKDTSYNRVREHVRIGENPFLVSIQHARTLTMLAGTRQILDIDTSVDPGVGALDGFPQLVPAMLFLRHAFGERCWQPARKLACFIVDDPLLRARYGYLRYNALVEAMERSNFATSIAFVPWNYNRSHRKAADLFLRHPKRLSLSIHGCDHTKDEFGGVDEVSLSRKAAIARKRMERHRQLTGVPFDNVMVFPQGVFSPVAMKALKTAGYLAAVNSTPFPVDASSEPLRVRDLLSPAVTRYSGFPLFIRRYPNCIAEFALDLFLGKPALIVEHHDYFRNGYQRVQAFAEQINLLSDGITWCGLEDIVRAACLKRRRDDGTFDAQFYDNRLSVVEDGRHDKESIARETVRVPVAFPAVDGDSDLQLGSPAYRMGVSVRRRLCEFRDNYLSRSRAVMAGLNMLKSKVMN
jgi:hypothetical protein